MRRHSSVCNSVRARTQEGDTFSLISTLATSPLRGAYLWNPPSPAIAVSPTIDRTWAVQAFFMYYRCASSGYSLCYPSSRSSAARSALPFPSDVGRFLSSRPFFIAAHDTHSSACFRNPFRPLRLASLYHEQLPDGAPFVGLRLSPRFVVLAGGCAGLRGIHDVCCTILCAGVLQGQRFWWTARSAPRSQSPWTGSA